MTRIHLLLLCALAVAICACEQHKASELAGEHGAGPAHPAEAKHEAAVPNAAPHDAKPAADGAQGEAPKFFPEKK